MIQQTVADRKLKAMLLGALGGCVLLFVWLAVSVQLDQPSTPCHISQDDVHFTTPPGVTEMNIHLKFRNCGDEDWNRAENWLYRTAGIQRKHSSPRILYLQPATESR